MDRVGGNASFLVSDPAWAEDFAPNGEFFELILDWPMGRLTCTGTLVKLGDLMTRKRYAK